MEYREGEKIVGIKAVLCRRIGCVGEIPISKFKTNLYRVKRDGYRQPKTNSD